MLIKFRVENHRSIRDEQVLSMEAARIDDAGDGRPREVANHATKLLPVAALYGANGSGKSNVLAAFAYMKEAVGQSHRLWAPDGGVPRDPFVWDEKRKEASLYEVEMMIAGVRHRYGFLCDDQVFLGEWLHAWPNGEEQVWFEREGDRFKFGDDLRGENEVVEGLTRPNSLYLSAFGQREHPQLSPIFAWFRSVRDMDMNRSITPAFKQFRSTGGPRVPNAPKENRKGNTHSVADDERAVAMIARLKAFLQEDEVDDVGFFVDPKPDSAKAPGWRGKFPPIVGVDLFIGGDPWPSPEDRPLGLRELSYPASSVMRAFRYGSVLLVDDLESSMPPMLADFVVRQFNDPAINRRNVQLIFSTHDANLLGTSAGDPALRRDQVWLTEKDPRGGTVLYPLADLKLREGENLERGRVRGKYGAVPFLGGFRVPSEDDA